MILSAAYLRVSRLQICSTEGNCDNNAIIILSLKQEDKIDKTYYFLGVLIDYLVTKKVYVRLT